MKRRSLLKSLAAAMALAAMPAMALAKQAVDVNRVAHLWGRALIIDKKATEKWYKSRDYHFIFTSLQKYIVQYNGRPGESLRVLMQECERMDVDNIHQVFWALENMERSTDWR